MLRRKLKRWDLLMSGLNVILPWFVLHLLLGLIFRGWFIIDEILVFIIVRYCTQLYVINLIIIIFHDYFDINLIKPNSLFMECIPYAIFFFLKHVFSVVFYWNIYKGLYITLTLQVLVVANPANTNPLILKLFAAQSYIYI